MNCLTVRELLPEYAVGVASLSDRQEVERHLRWCAGCRKESSDLEQAASSLAFALAPAAVPDGLSDRIVERVGRASRKPGTSRRLRTTAAGIIAAAVAVASLGWGAVMAGRADRFEQRAAQAQQARADAIEQFLTLLEEPIPGRPVSSDEVRLAQLAPAAADGQGGGFALQLGGPTTIDFTFVIVNGLDTRDADRLPYRVQLFNASGDMLRAGRIEELDADGGAELFRQFAHAELTGYTIVRIVDAAGQPVLTGTVHNR